MVAGGEAEGMREERELERLRRLYRHHHESGDRHDFTVSEDRRGPLFAGWIGRGKRVLDIGCGDGALTRYFAEGNRVLGLDVDKDALARAAARLGIETRWADVSLSLQVPDATFDCVVTGEVIEHLPYLNVILDEVARVLAPRALFIGSVPNAYNLKSRINVLRGQELDRDPTHLQFFSPAKLRRVLDSRFNVQEICSVRGKWAWLSLALFARHLAWRAVRK
jgi:2-polyprenyl-3-methyl-5-hydroxy-6-metoxy-1,4-benzoquinol methylase